MCALSWSFVKSLQEISVSAGILAAKTFRMPTLPVMRIKGVPFS